MGNNCCNVQDGQTTDGNFSLRAAEFQKKLKNHQPEMVMQHQPDSSRAAAVE